MSAPGASGGAPIAGQRILIVEDEYFIAADLRRALDQAGATVVGPVGEVGAALRLVEMEALDMALLDVNLAGEASYSVAEALERRGVPMLFLTGYDAWSMPERYRAAPRMAKPFVADALVALAGDLVKRGHPS